MAYDTAYEEATGTQMIEDDSLTQFQETITSSSPTAQEIKKINTASHLMGCTQGFVPICGYSKSKGMKRAPKQAGSQLNENLVPREDTLSIFVEKKMTEKPKSYGVHMNAQLVPSKEYDAGMGFEGWYTNGVNNCINPVGQSHIDPRSGMEEREGKEMENHGGFYVNNREGGSFALPQKHIVRTSSVTGLSTVGPGYELAEPVYERDNVAFKAPARARAVARKSPTNAEMMMNASQDMNRWTTSYDTTFSPMNEREYYDPRKSAAAKSLSKSQKQAKSSKSKRTFQWRRKSSTLAQPKAKPWSQGAKNVEIPSV